MSRPNHRARLMAALKQHGPMTAADLADRLDMPPRQVGASIASARYQQPNLIFRIVRYVPVIGQRLRDICVFAAEAGPDVKRKPYRGDKFAKRRAEAKGRYRERHRATINARNHVRKTALAGRPITSNPWLQLAEPSARSTMARIAGA